MDEWKNEYRCQEGRGKAGSSTAAGLECPAAVEDIHGENIGQRVLQIRCCSYS